MCRPWRCSLLLIHLSLPGLSRNQLQEMWFVDSEPTTGAGTHMAHTSALLASSPPWEKPSAWGREQWAVSHMKRMKPGLTRAPGTEQASKQLPAAHHHHLGAEPCLGASACVEVSSMGLPRAPGVPCGSVTTPTQTPQKPCGHLCVEARVQVWCVCLCVCV